MLVFPGKSVIGQMLKYNHIILLETHYFNLHTLSQFVDSMLPCNYLWKEFNETRSLIQYRKVNYFVCIVLIFVVLILL